MGISIRNIQNWSDIRNIEQETGKSIKVIVFDDLGQIDEIEFFEYQLVRGPKGQWKLEKSNEGYAGVLKFVPDEEAQKPCDHIYATMTKERTRENDTWCLKCGDVPKKEAQKKEEPLCLFCQGKGTLNEHQRKYMFQQTWEYRHLEKIYERHHKYFAMGARNCYEDEMFNAIKRVLGKQ